MNSRSEDQGVFCFLFLTFIKSLMFHLLLILFFPINFISIIYCYDGVILSDI